MTNHDKSHYDIFVDQPRMYVVRKSERMWRDIQVCPPSPK